MTSFSQSTAHRQLVLDTFKLAGLAINESKSHLQFTRLLTHLDFVIDLDSPLVSYAFSRTFFAFPLYL